MPMQPLYSIPAPAPQSGDDWDVLRLTPGEGSGEISIEDPNRSSSGIFLPMMPKLEPQPEPIACKLTWFRVAGRTITTIARLWRPEDISGDRCKLCPKCKADPAGLCLVRAPGYVKPEEARLFRLTDAGGAGGGGGDVARRVYDGVAERDGTGR